MFVAFRACEIGHKDVVQALLDYGADGRAHPATKYSPLYIACFNGRKDIVEMLLRVSCFTTVITNRFTFLF